MMRISCLLLSLGLLAACEREPVVAKSAAPALQAEPRTQAAETSVAPAEPQVADAVQTVEPAQTATTKAAPPPQPRPKPAAPAAKPTPQVALDLSVPHELLEQLSGEVGSIELAPLLPPLFVEKSEQGNPFQLSGRLISNERDDDYWDSIEGAELQFEFKQ